MQQQLLEILFYITFFLKKKIYSEASVTIINKQIEK